MQNTSIKFRRLIFIKTELNNIGTWGRLHYDFLYRNNRTVINVMWLNGTLNNYLADIDRHAEEMFSLLINQLSEKEGVTEALKAEHLMLWVQKMNSIRNTAMEVVSNDLIYA